MSDPATDASPPATIGTTSGPIVVWLRGEIDIGVADDLRALVEMIDPAAEVLFDLSDTTFVDSTGLTIFIAAYKRCAAVTLRAVPQMARKLLELTGLDQLVTVTD